MTTLALTGVAQLAGHRATEQRVTGLISGWDTRWGPPLGHIREATNQGSLSHRCPLPLFLPPFPCEKERKEGRKY